MLAPAAHPAPMRFRDVAIVIAIGALATVIGAYVAAWIEPMVTSWRYGLGLYLPTPDAVPVLGVHPISAWLVGGVIGGLATTLLLTSRAAPSRWVRGLALAVALGCVGLAIATLVYHSLPWSPPVLHVVVLGLGAVAAGHVAFRRRVAEAPGRNGRIAIVAAVLTEAIAIGAPTLIEAQVEYRSQALRPFTIEMVTAYRDDARVPQPGEPVEYNGQRYVLHRSDRLVIPSASVERVRWIDGGISIRVDTAIAHQLAARSKRRFDQFDALLIDGQLVSIPRYESFLTDRLWLTGPDTAELRRIYDRLAL